MSTDQRRPDLARPLTAAHEPEMLSLPPMYPGGNRIGVEEEQAVLEVLRSKRLFRYYGPTPGPSAVATFEAELVNIVGCRHAIAVSSGTTALAAALAALGVGPGDEVIVPAYTWISTPAAVLSVGAVPVIAEVDESLTIDPADAEAQITEATKVILPVHMRGAPANMRAILDVAKRNGVKVLEDAAQAVGGSYGGRRLGTLGDIGIFSLQFNKIITCGEGGVVLTDDPGLYERALMYHDVAASLRAGRLTSEALIGITCRMSELQGAVARVQLGRLEGILGDCRRNRQWLISEVQAQAHAKGLAFRASNDPTGDTAIALVLIAPDPDRARRLADSARERGVNAQVLFDKETPDYHVAPHWAPILNRKSWGRRGPWDSTDPAHPAYGPGRWSKTVDILARSVHFDVSPDLTESQLQFFAATINAGIVVL
jgi:8-amino-3,8-dideoxy-alpha-D-manno-octulosonate transaminase